MEKDILDSRKCMFRLNGADMFIRMVQCFDAFAGRYAHLQINTDMDHDNIWQKCSGVLWHYADITKTQNVKPKDMSDSFEHPDQIYWGSLGEILVGFVNGTAQQVPGSGIRTSIASAYFDYYGSDVICQADEVVFSVNGERAIEAFIRGLYLFRQVRNYGPKAFASLYSSVDHQVYIWRLLHERHPGRARVVVTPFPFKVSAFKDYYAHPEEYMNFNDFSKIRDRVIDNYKDFEARMRRLNRCTGVSSVWQNGDCI
jgi:hypothetical protein